ncbi:cAMP-dependent protein kinase regulatory subunit (cAPK regulatory subunit) (Bypass of cyclase mutations protein 1) (Protein kinase A regulatory subunit) (PKA regulatory subunit) [Durusdinium trenchii]|uniref:cAMP-dependent protein kinase regulatory subunit (CAPK regulatory subunit) (Bypass of cyclase mutations protein 1) (Protein kinase A regulatory subunit) (PKA regulatory subunit) n=1 Tax=Durusdinium trenchii TaxID=1381693 RepID=A0ABP0RU87_9DINO
MAEDSEEIAEFGEESKVGKVKPGTRRHSAANVPAKESAEGRRKSLARRSSLKGAGHFQPSEKRAVGRRASLDGSLHTAAKLHNNVDEPTSPASPSKPMLRRRASAASVANVRRASMSGSVAATLVQARIERRRLSQGLADTHVSLPKEDEQTLDEETNLNKAVTMLERELTSVAPSEALCGVQVRKPSDRAKAEETEGEKAGPKMPENGKLLQQTALFGRLSDQALIFVAENSEERNLRFSEVLYKEGDKHNQDWLGLVIAGQLTQHIHEPMDRETGDPLPILEPGMLFGELSALSVTQVRHSTVAAEVDSKVLVIRSETIWEAVHDFNDDVQRMTAECECWRAFMSCEVASMCHPHVAYFLREVSVVKKLAPGEEYQLSVTNQKRQVWAAGVIERGEALVKESGEVLKARDMVNVAAMLGMKSSYTVVSHEVKGCQIAVIDRVAFWSLMKKFHKAKEVYTRWALSQLPSATTDIAHLPMLQYLEGSESFFRALAGSIRQRVAPPRTVAIVSKDVFETLVFLQQGLADVILHGHKVRELHAGEGLGDLNLMSIQALAGMTVIATEFCVLQELKKNDLESHLSRQPVARSKWRELLKLRNVWKQDGAALKQISMLRDSPFFGEDLSAEFMRVVHGQMEARIYFPEQQMQKEDDAGDLMILLCEGQVERQADGHKILLDVGAVVGESGLISNVDGRLDVLTAKSTCAVMVLHRMNMIDTLKRHPEAKPHFEAVTRRFRAGHQEEGEESWNIYRMSCFKDCSSRFLYLVDLHLERHIFFSDEIVVTENTEGEDMYILYSGTMDVQVKGIKVGSLEGGMFFGEMAVLGLVKKRSATIVAVSLCDVRVLSRKSLEEAINEFPQELSRFEELAATRNRMSLERRNGGRVHHLCSFFRDCKADFAIAIANDMQDRLFTTGQVIIKEGSDHGSLFLIHQGAATVSCAGEKVSELKTGDLCGELVAMGLSPVSTATVTATDTCFMQELPKKTLLEVLERFPQERQQLRHVAALRMEWKHSLHGLQMFEWVSSSTAAMANKLEQLLTRWIFFCNDEIVIQGEPGDSLFMISIGFVEVLQNQHVIRELGGGDVFGELCALGISTTRTATVRCKDICDVFVLAKAAVEQVFSLYPTCQEPVRRLATVRMRSDVERMSEKHILLHCPLFQQSSRKFLERISDHMEDRLFMEGEDLCKQGEKGDTMFILVQGVLDVKVLQQGVNVKVNELSAGSVIGEIAVLGLANHRTATLTAQKVCLVQVLHRPILMKYLNEFPREIATFQEVGASRLTKSGVSKDTLFPQQDIATCSRPCDKAKPLICMK